MKKWSTLCWKYGNSSGQIKRSYDEFLKLFHEASLFASQCILCNKQLQHVSKVRKYPWLTIRDAINLVSPISIWPPTSHSSASSSAFTSSRTIYKIQSKAHYLWHLRIFIHNSSTLVILQMVCHNLREFSQFRWKCDIFPTPSAICLTQPNLIKVSSFKEILMCPIVCWQLLPLLEQSPSLSPLPEMSYPRDLWRGFTHSQLVYFDLNYP